MWRRKFVNYSAAHTLALWAIALAFALTGIMLNSLAVPVLIGLGVATAHLGILRSVEARNIRAEAQTRSPWFLIRAAFRRGARAHVPSETSQKFNARAQRLLEMFESDAKPFCLAIVEVRNGLAPTEALNAEAIAALADDFRRLAGDRDSVLQTDGSKFLVLMENAREAQAEMFRWRLVHSIDALGSAHPDLVAPITSVGVAECSDSVRTLKALTKRARKNCYQPSWSAHELQAA